MTLPTHEATPDSLTPREPSGSKGIFLHAGWRSAGTWIWSRFRVLPTVTAYYEPLHPILGDLSLADVPAVGPAFTSGHPALSEPYFDEYRSLITAQGVEGYRKSFATDRFGGDPDSTFAAVQGYLRHLCDTAISHGNTPVFKFCRSSGRLPWLKAAFPDMLHASVLRNPASQFASGWTLLQQWSNPFFVATPFRLLGLNQMDPVVRQVIELCGVRLSAAPVTSADEYAALCEQYVRTVDGDSAYRAFMAVWILSAARMAQSADVIIDQDRLGGSKEYVTELRETFAAQTRLMPDFSGVRNLVEETRRGSTRMKGVDGRSMRPVHSAAQKFMVSQKASLGLRSDITELVREKLVLANELSEQWRY